MARKKAKVIVGFAVIGVCLFYLVISGFQKTALYYFTVGELEAREHEVTARHLFVEPDSEQLGLLARMVDQGRLQPHVQKIYPLSDAAEALQLIEEGHVRGKLVLNL